MRLRDRLLFLLILILSTQVYGDTKLAIHLLSYLAQDYGEAVREGKVVSSSEYAEQLEFIVEVVRSGETEKFPQEILSEINGLQKLIMNKATREEVAVLATGIRWKLIKHYQIPTGPTGKPDQELGKKLYIKDCASCHGHSGLGDGEDGKGLDPAPANFHDRGRFSSVSPFQAFTTITLGVPGTGMRSFSELNEHQRWSLASYVMDFHYENAALRDPQKEISTEDRWSLSDKELESKYKINDDGSIRFVRQNQKVDSTEGQSDRALNLALSKLYDSLSEYNLGNYENASKLAFESYLEGVEPIEPLIDQKKIAEIESRYFSYRALIRRRLSKEKLAKEYRQLTITLESARPLLSKKHAFIQTFLFSFGIVFREILEAALVILLLLSMLKKLEAKDSASWIHGGWILAVILGAGLALVLNKTLEISGMLIENLEGYIGLVAVIMLLSLALWLHGHGQIEQWKAYLRERMTNHLMKKQMLGLSLISFTAVFREMIETILFIKILRINGHPGFAISAGVIGAIIVTLTLVLGMLKLSLRVNFEKLMRASTALLLFFAFTLAGKSIHALQLTGSVTSNEVFSLTVPFLGIYGTWETLGSQLLIIVLVIMKKLKAMSNRPQ